MQAKDSSRLRNTSWTNTLNNVISQAVISDGKKAL